MSDVPRILPTTPVQPTHPLRPTRESGREPRRPRPESRPRRDREREREHDDAERPTTAEVPGTDAEQPDGRDDESGDGKPAHRPHIDLRV